MASNDPEQPEVVQAGEQSLRHRLNQSKGSLLTVGYRNFTALHARALPILIYNDGHREVEKRKGSEHNLRAARYEAKS